MNIEQMVVEAGMVSLMNHGGASCVYSEGCHGVTQEHLERFAALVRAQALEEAATVCDSMQDHEELQKANKKAREAEKAGDKRGQLSRLQHWSVVSTFNAGLNNAAQAIRDLKASPDSTKQE